MCRGVLMIRTHTKHGLLFLSSSSPSLLHASCLPVRSDPSNKRQTGRWASGKSMMRRPCVMKVRGREWRGQRRLFFFFSLRSIAGTDLFMIMISRHHRSLFLSLSSWRHCFIAICSSVSWKNTHSIVWDNWSLRASLSPTKDFQTSWATHYISLPAFPDSMEEKAPPCFP